MRPPKETKDERFRRLAEVRVNKILDLFRLLGNLSGTANYIYSKEQVEQIFTTLQLALVKTKMRFLQSPERKKKRFRTPFMLTSSKVIKEGVHRVCIGAYCAEEEDTKYYGPYVTAERNSDEQH